MPESAQTGAKPVNASIIPLKANFLNMSKRVGKRKHREVRAREDFQERAGVTQEKPPLGLVKKDVPGKHPGTRVSVILLFPSSTITLLWYYPLW